MSTGAKKTILVVEDADAIRKMVCAMLTQNGYRCLEAVNGVDALRQLDGESIHLVLTDVVMPKMGGAELAKHLSKHRPETRIIFMSGYHEDPVIRDLERSPARFLAKPFTGAALMQKVRDILENPWSGVSEIGTSSQPQ